MTVIDKQITIHLDYSGNQCYCINSGQYDCIINLKVELSNIVLFHEVADYLYMEGCSFLRNAEILKVYTVCKI